MNRFAPWALGLVLAFPAASAAAEDPPIPVIVRDGLEPAVVAALDAAEAAVAAAGSDPAAGAAAWSDLGRIYQAHDFREAAVVAYEAALALDPGRTSDLYALGRTQEAAGRIEEAIGAYRRVIARDPRHLPAAYRLARNLVESGRAEEASLALALARNLAPDEAAVLALGGQAALEEGRPGEAARLFEAALMRAPSATALHYPLALALRQSGDEEGARAHAEAAGPVGVTVPDPLETELDAIRSGERLRILEGRRAWAVGDLPGAEAAFREAVAVGPQSAPARVNLAAVVAERGDLEEAEHLLGEALRLDPTSATAHFNLGVLRLRRGDRTGAREAMTTAAELDPSDAQVRLELARLELATGEPELALVRYREATERDSQLEDAWFEGGRLLVRLGRPAEALAVFEEANRRLPWAGRIAAELAWLLATGPAPTRDGARALELASAVFGVAATPEHGGIVAAALAELGRCAEAASWQEQAIDALRTAGVAEAALGEPSARLERYRAGAPCGAPAGE